MKCQAGWITGWNQDCQEKYQQPQTCKWYHEETVSKFRIWGKDEVANIRWITEKGREFQKNIYFCFIDYAKALTVWMATNCGQFFKRWEYQTTSLVSWKTCMQVKKQQLELDMEQQTGSKLGKELCQGCILPPCLFSLYAEYIMWNARLDES